MLLYGNVFINTATGEHIDPKDMFRHNGRWILRGNT
jgi:hypothetical protein